MHQPNVGPFWPSTCKAASASDLSADHCDPLISELGFIDTSKKPTVKKSGNDYTVTYAGSSSVGDLVWTVPTTMMSASTPLGDCAVSPPASRTE